MPEITNRASPGHVPAIVFSFDTNQDGTKRTLKSLRLSGAAPCNASLLAEKYAPAADSIEAIMTPFKAGLPQGVDVEYKSYKAKFIAFLAETINHHPPADYEALLTRHLEDVSSVLPMYSTSRLLLGIGEASILETHLTLHPLYGFPYLPGSSQKGVARHWMNENLDSVELLELIEEYGTALVPPRTPRVVLNRLFGCEPKGKTPGREGEIVFFDAWPETYDNECPLVTPDVLTPHQSSYYSTEGREAPAETSKPVPVSLLAVSRGLCFVAALKHVGAPRGAGVDDREALVAVGQQVLRQALQANGIGAKTGSGYGYLE